uniref:PNPLA domain-containing protein n=1 Tax=Mastacembelus armatus TaxID=205130 RepID=A0A3Q3LR25_9TELE
VGLNVTFTALLGVVQCFLNYAPWIACTAPRVLGASAGSLVAAMLHFAKQVKAFTLGPFDPSISIFHWLECVLRKYLPSDAHQLASGRLAVAMTRLVDGKNICMSEFQSKEDLHVVLRLCYVAALCLCTVVCGLHPSGECDLTSQKYMDGGFSSMQPVSGPASHTLTVSPYSGEADICPADPPCMWDIVVAGTNMKLNMANSFRMLSSLYPRTLEVRPPLYVLEQAYHNGYKDAFHFLLQKGASNHEGELQN